MGIGGLDAILLTHGHWDHICGLDSLKKDFPETPVYIFEDDLDFLTTSYLNCSETNGFRLVLQSEAEPITEGELDIGAYHVQVIHTPGHTKGSVMYCSGYSGNGSSCQSGRFEGTAPVLYVAFLCAHKGRRFGKPQSFRN